METAVFACTRRSKRFLHFFRRFSAFLLFLLISAVLIYNLQIMPALFPLTKTIATTEITRGFQRAIRLASEETDFDFIRLSYDSEGGVTALQTDTAAIAVASASITEAAIQTLCREKQVVVQIPIGNLSGGALFMGRGPNISVPITVSKAITCEIENEFYDSGINQTVHRIVAEIETEAYALLPFSVKKFPIEAEVCLAETIIVGRIPDAYTKINRLGEDLAESDIDDIFDFGAQAE